MHYLHPKISYMYQIQKKPLTDIQIHMYVHVHVHACTLLTQIIINNYL